MENAPAAPTLRAATNRPEGRRYVLISPCRDEEQYARVTIESVANQTELPALWIIVDDGSTDSTPQILAEAAAKYPFIRIITRADRGERRLGGGVIDAFYAGYETIDPSDFDFICKLDLDLDLPPHYFAGVMDIMAADPRLGTFSGKPYFKDSRGRLVSERCGDENSVGMAKFYRVAAFRQIGGFVRELMWDGIDGHRCRMLGWRAGSRDERDLRFIHLRPMGTSHKNWWTGRVRHGIGQYFMGTSPQYMFASALYRMTRPPRLVGGLAMMWGYFQSWWQDRARFDEPGFREFLRDYQKCCLLMGKTRATHRLDMRQASVWDPMAAPASTGVDW